MERQALAVDPANREQLQAWDGDEGHYWAEHADQFDLALRGYRTPFLGAAAIRPTDRVLDVGCGTGETTRDAARQATAGRALGVDLSAEMLRLARQRAAGEELGNAHFERADAQVHPFRAGGFDVVISRTGTMFFADPVAGFRNVARALRPGGRMVQLVWQAASYNEWFLAFTTALAAGRPLPMPPPGAPGPFALADPAQTRGVLTQAGFTEPSFQALAAPMHFGPDADSAHRFVTGQLGWILEGLDDARRERALADLRTTIQAHLGPDGVRYPSAAWLITATRP